MARKRGRSSGRKAKREGQWGGIQFPQTNVVTAGNFFDFANNLGTEERDRTCVTVRGWLQFANSGSDSATAGVEFAAKMVKANLNDALTITDDVQAIDTSLEDIQQRQLWTMHGQLFARGTNNQMQDIMVEINVKVKIRLPARSKTAFGLLVDASVVNRLQVNGYLRAYYLF